MKDKAEIEERQIDGDKGEIQKKGYIEQVQMGGYRGEVKERERRDK